jgi:hypothetical protein
MTEQELVAEVVHQAIRAYEHDFIGNAFSDAVRALLSFRNEQEQAREQEQKQHEFVWVTRTWRDVRSGDAVRMPGREEQAFVRSAQLQPWHVDPRSSEYSPTPLRYEVMRVALDIGVTYDMDPAKAVEICMTRDEVAAVELIGWENRVGVYDT